MQHCDTKSYDASSVVLHSQTLVSKPNQTKPNQTKPNQTKPNQTKPNQTKPNQTKEYTSAATINNTPLIDAEEAHKLQAEQDALFNAARSTGFQMTDVMMSQLMGLRDEYGQHEVLEGLKACVDTPKYAYLSKVLYNRRNGIGKPAPRAQVTKTVPAQQYEQREYEPGEAADEFMAALRKMGGG